MSKRQAFYESIFDEGGLILPADAGAKKELLQRLLGSQLVACVDVLIEEAIGLLQSEEEHSQSGVAHQKRLRSQLASLDPAQRAAVTELIQRTAYGVLAWQCVKLDQFNAGAIGIDFLNYDDEGELNERVPLVSPAERELRHQYYDWVEEFGDYYLPPSDKGR